jgi:hypothetical protein
LRHEGYLGAVGAFMKRRPASWKRRRGSTGNEVVEEVGEAADSTGG